MSDLHKQNDTPQTLGNNESKKSGLSVIPQQRFSNNHAPNIFMIRFVSCFPERYAASNRPMISRHPILTTQSLLHSCFTRIYFLTSSPLEHEAKHEDSTTGPLRIEFLSHIHCRTELARASSPRPRSHTSSVASHHPTQTTHRFEQKQQQNHFRAIIFALIFLIKQLCQNKCDQSLSLLFFFHLLDPKTHMYLLERIFSSWTPAFA